MGRPEAVAACQVQRLNENFWPTPTRLSNCVIVDTSVILLRSRSSFGEGFNPIICLRSKRLYSSLNFFSTHSISGLSWEAGSLRKPQCGQTHFLLSILTVSCVGLYEASKSIFSARIISISLSSFLNFLGFQWNAHPFDSTKSGDFHFVVHNLSFTAFLVDARLTHRRCAFFDFYHERCAILLIVSFSLSLRHRTRRDLSTHLVTVLSSARTPRYARSPAPWRLALGMGHICVTNSRLIVKTSLESVCW